MNPGKGFLLAHLRVDVAHADDDVRRVAGHIHGLHVDICGFSADQQAIGKRKRPLFGKRFPDILFGKGACEKHLVLFVDIFERIFVARREEVFAVPLEREVLADRVRIVFRESFRVEIHIV